MKRPSEPNPLRLAGDRVARPPRVLPSADTAPRLRMRRGPRSASARLMEVVHDETADALAAKAAGQTPQMTGLAAYDPRWVLAVRANYVMDGGRAAILPPESRAYLIDLARMLGLRAFDASLIIAIVQDAKRQTGDGLTPDARARLGLIRDPATVKSYNWLGFTFGVLLTAAMLTWIASRWFLAGQ